MRGNIEMKRVILVVTLTISVAIAGCADSTSDLVAKINAAYHTRFTVANQNDTVTVPSPP
jgi:hypothetical protein